VSIFSRVREHIFHDVASGQLGIYQLEFEKVTVRMTYSMKARLVALSALSLLARGETDVGPLRDARSLSDAIALMHRVFVSSLLVCCDAMRLHLGNQKKYCRGSRPGPRGPVRIEIDLGEFQQV
jgi:hypothetical protein